MEQETNQIKPEVKKPTIEEISAGLTSLCSQGIEKAKEYGNSAMARYVAKLCLAINWHHERLMEQVKILQKEHWEMYSAEMERHESKKDG